MIRAEPPHTMSPGSPQEEASMRRLNIRVVGVLAVAFATALAGVHQARAAGPCPSRRARR